MSIQRKLMLILVLTATVPLLLTCGLIIVYEFVGERTTLANELTMLADITGWNSGAAVVFHDEPSARHILEGLKAESNILAACLYDAGGQLMASYQTVANRQACSRQSPAVGQVFGEGRLVLTRAIVLEGERIGTVCVHSDLSKQYARTMDYLRVIPMVLFGALVVTVLLSTRLQRVVAGPILHLARVAQIVSRQKDYSVRAPKGSNDEVGVLIDAFNGMLAQIAQHASELTRMNHELTVSRDAAERAAAALSESEGRFRATFDEGPIGMTLVDATGAIVEGNRSLQGMLGYTRRELCRMRFSDFTHPDDFHADLAQFHELIEGRLARYQIEKRYRTKDDRTVWARVTVSRLHGHHGELLAIAMIEDMSAHKHLEEQFRQSQKMEAVGRLAGGVAHDFNNLLTVIKGNTELLIKRLALDSPMHRNLAQVRKAADRAAALVEQLLAFSRKQFVAPRVLDLNPVVRDMEKMLRPLIGEDIELTVDVAAGAARVNSDPVQLEQILMNLAVNARDAMPDGGHLTIRTRIFREGNAPGASPDVPPAPYVTLSVEDTGIGMTEQVRLHIFEPFFTTKEVGKGTGLGLSTVYGLIRQAGGSIQVDTTLGRGSTFTVYLPLVYDAAHDTSTESELEALNCAGRETVLVVEDEELVRTILCETLNENGYNVLEGQNPMDALELVRQYASPIDLLVTDIVMPRMNGCQLADEIRLLRPGIQVLYMSGYTEKGLAVDSPFLKKPFTPDELLGTVRKILDGIPPPAGDRLTADLMHLQEVVKQPEALRSKSV